VPHDSVLDATFAAAEANDWVTFRSMFADDAVLKQNVGPDQSVDQAMKTLPLFTADGTTLRYENVRRVRGESSITEMHDAVFTKPDGRVVRIDICVVVQFNNDAKIIRTDEYLDSAAAAGLRG
jgi:ketosteroid isomerase-like protein